MMQQNTENIVTNSARAAKNIQDRPIFRRIVIGFHCDEPSRCAMRVAALLASDVGSELIVAASVPAPIGTPSTVLHPDLYDEVSADVRNHLRRELETLAGISGQNADLYVSFASPVTHILTTAEQVGADLILVGCHGKHGLEQLILGSISESLAVKSICPVMVIGPECEIPEERLQTVLFANDLENTGLSTGLFAAALARKTHCRIVALHAAHEKPSPIGGEREWKEDHLREQLRLSLQEDGAPNPAPVEFRISYGNAAEEILAAAADTEAGLIILGSGIHNFVADHAPWRTVTPILEHAHCPVILVSRKCP